MHDGYLLFDRGVVFLLVLLFIIVVLVVLPVVVYFESVDFVGVDTKSDPRLRRLRCFIICSMARRRRRDLREFINVTFS